MTKEEVRQLIKNYISQSNTDPRIIDALWELYDSKCFTIRYLPNSSNDEINKYNNDRIYYEYDPWHLTTTITNTSDSSIENFKNF